MPRECGQCSLCCRVMGVPEVKAEHEWCPHAKPGKGGCAIYPDRPDRCRAFSCRWLIDDRFPDYWYPLKSKIVVHTVVKPNDISCVVFVVDPNYPNRWREEPYFSDIKKTAELGLSGKLGEKFATLIVLKNEQIPIIKDRAIKLHQPANMPPAPGSNP